MKTFILLFFPLFDSVHEERLVGLRSHYHELWVGVAQVAQGSDSLFSYLNIIRYQFCTLTPTPSHPSELSSNTSIPFTRIENAIFQVICARSRLLHFIPRSSPPASLLTPTTHRLQSTFHSSKLTRIRTPGKAFSKPSSTILSPSSSKTTSRSPVP